MPFYFPDNGVYIPEKKETLNMEFRVVTTDAVKNENLLSLLDYEMISIFF